MGETEQKDVAKWLISDVKIVLFFFSSTAGAPNSQWQVAEEYWVSSLFKVSPGLIRPQKILHGALREKVSTSQTRHSPSLFFHYKQKWRSEMKKFPQFQREKGKEKKVSPWLTPLSLSFRLAGVIKMVQIIAAGGD